MVAVYTDPAVQYSRIGAVGQEIVASCCKDFVEVFNLQQDIHPSIQAIQGHLHAVPDDLKLGCQILKSLFISPLNWLMQ